ALDFKVNGTAPGSGDVKLDQAGPVKVTAKVAFAKNLMLRTAVGGPVPVGETRKVELVVNGKVVAAKDVPADDKPHDLSFDVQMDRSWWAVLGHFPQMHMNTAHEN